MIPEADRSFPPGAVGVDVGASLAKLAARYPSGALRLSLFPSQEIERAAREIEALEPGRVGVTGAGSDLPTLYEVSASYLPRNRPPTVKLTAPAGGEYWKGSATLRWTGADADHDTLSYDLTYSTDGKTWLPLGRPPSAPAASTQPSSNAKARSN